MAMAMGVMKMVIVEYIYFFRIYSGGESIGELIHVSFE